VLGCVLRLEGDPSIYANTVTHDALRRLGAHPTVDAARRAVERAIGTEEGELWPFERVTATQRITPRAFALPVQSNGLLRQEIVD
jgi:hypothetical protein